MLSSGPLFFYLCGTTHKPPRATWGSRVGPAGIRRQRHVLGDLPLQGWLAVSYYPHVAPIPSLITAHEPPKHPNNGPKVAAATCRTPVLSMPCQGGGDSGARSSVRGESCGEPAAKTPRVQSRTFGDIGTLLFLRALSLGPYFSLPCLFSV